MSLKSESGMTVIELLAGIIGFIAIFGAIMEMTIVATHQSDRITYRVVADQRARPVMTRVMDGLRSACVAPRVAPIAPGSTATSMTFISKAGSAVTPVPDRRVLTLSGTTLTEQVFPATGGTPPVWTFSGHAVVDQDADDPGDGAHRRDVPLLRLRQRPAVRRLPLPVPLSSTSAARTAYVDGQLDRHAREGSLGSLQPGHRIADNPH